MPGFPEDMGKFRYSKKPWFLLNESLSCKTVSGVCESHSKEQYYVIWVRSFGGQKTALLAPLFLYMFNATHNQIRINIFIILNKWLVDSIFNISMFLFIWIYLFIEIIYLNQLNVLSWCKLYRTLWSDVSSVCISHDKCHATHILWIKCFFTKCAIGAVFSAILRLG